MSDLIDTTEMYLKTIFELEEDGVTPLRARIVERLGHSGPTVSQTIGRMERDGLVHVMGDRRLELTALGRERAIEVVRKHRLAERLLTDVIGLDWAHTHEEACPDDRSLWKPNSWDGWSVRRYFDGTGIANGGVHLWNGDPNR